VVGLADLTRRADQVRRVGISDGYLADAPDLLDFDVDEVDAAPIAGDQWPVAWLLAVDLVAAAIALPLALLLLASISPAESNSLSRFWVTRKATLHFP